MAPGMQRVVERLDADPVPDEDHLLPARVVEGHGEHPVEIPEGGSPLLLVEVENRLRVGDGPVAVAPGLQGPPEIPVVVDFAVERDPERLVLVGHGLAPRGGEIHDGEPAVPEAGATIRRNPDTRVVRPPMGQGVPHPFTRIGSEMSVEGGAPPYRNTPQMPHIPGPLQNRHHAGRQALAGGNIYSAPWLVQKLTGNVEAAQEVAQPLSAEVAPEPDGPGRYRSHKRFRVCKLEASDAPRAPPSTPFEPLPGPPPRGGGWPGGAGRPETRAPPRGPGAAETAPPGGAPGPSGSLPAPPGGEDRGAPFSTPSRYDSRARRTVAASWNRARKARVSSRARRREEVRGGGIHPDSLIQLPAEAGVEVEGQLHGRIGRQEGGRGKPPGSRLVGVRPSAAAKRACISPRLAACLMARSFRKAT